MDWLYNELDQSHSAQFQQHLGSCASCGAELRSLERTRAAFRDLGSEEPPPSVSAILLHEAAKRAPAASAMNPEGAAAGIGGWLAKLFRPLMAHPAAAAVASLVLVAGVAGTIYVQRGDHVARPSAETGESASAAAAPAPEPIPAVSTTPTGNPAKMEMEESGPAPATPPANDKWQPDDGYAANVADKNAQRELRAAADQAVADRDESRRRSKPDEVRLQLHSETQAAKPGSAAPKTLDRGVPLANAVSGTDPLIAADEEREFAKDLGGAPAETAQGAAMRKSDRTRGAAPADPQAAAAEPAPPTETTLALEGGTKKAPEKTLDASSKKKSKQDLDAAQSAGDEGKFRAYREETNKWAKGQRAALVRAYKSNDCVRAASIANDILDRDPDYYTANVKNSREVKDCKFYVSDEKARRQKSRAAKAKTSVDAAEKAE